LVFNILCLCVDLDHFVLVLLAFIVLGLVSSILSWRERIQKGLWDVKS